MHSIILLVVLACLGQELIYTALLECDLGCRLIRDRCESKAESDGVTETHLQAFLVLIEELGALVAVRLPITS